MNERKFIMKKFISIVTAAAAAASLTVSAFAYDINTDLGFGWTATTVIPAEEFADVTADTTITITYKTNPALANLPGQEYWCIKPHRQDLEAGWQFMDDWKGVTLSESKDSYSVDVESSQIKFRLSADPTTVNGEEVCGSLEAAKINGIAFMGHGVELLEMSFSDEPLDETAPSDDKTASDDKSASDDKTDSASTDKTDSTSTAPANPDSGVESVAAVAGAAALALGALIVTKKRNH